MGGTDDSKNLITITIEQHAEEHRILYEKYNKWEDYIAWKSLSKQINPSDASKLAHIIGSYKGGYAKKPNKVPAWNKLDCYCVGCRKKIKPSSPHIKCVQKAFNLEPTKNSSYFSSEYGKLKANQNNSMSICPHCNKEGQYRAMKRWHFDRCKFNLQQESFD